MIYLIVDFNAVRRNTRLQTYAEKVNLGKERIRQEKAKEKE